MQQNKMDFGQKVMIIKRSTKKREKLITLKAKINQRDKRILKTILF
jgi:hypothetical protein